MLLAVFIYWGWDSDRRRVNEETEDSNEAPGLGGGRQHPDPARDLPDRRHRRPRPTPASSGLLENQEDVLSSLGTEVFGSPLDKILIIAVLTSAAASTQTTILPTARTTLSMARAEGDAGAPRARSTPAT